MYVLDTNVISEFRKIGDGKANPDLVTWQSNIEPENFYLSPITVFELKLGILRLAARQPDRSQMLGIWLDRVVFAEFRERILPVTTQIAIQCAKLHVLQNRPYNDAWIAATALVHDMIVVTRNVADFKPTGVRLLNPWQPQR